MKSCICMFVLMFAVTEKTVVEMEPRAKVTSKFVNVSLNCCHVNYLTDLLSCWELGAEFHSQFVTVVFFIDLLHY